MHDVHMDDERGTAHSELGDSYVSSVMAASV